MRIIFEEHQYEAAKVQVVLKDISTLQDVEQKISVSYVGYYYNPSIGDCVFILPKVLLTDKNKHEVLANVVSKETGEDIKPEDIITQEGQEKHLPKDYRKFLYEFAVWIYRSLSVYRKLNKESKAIYYRQLPQEGKGRRREINTYLDIVLSLIRFNQENQNFFLFTIKNLHSGLNKINWSKTISRSQPLIQQDDVLYLDPVNKKRQVNYEEELFVIFFSILNYLNETYGFRTPINCNYELIKGYQFENYLKGRGKIHLRQIKYKYFADKTLQLWDLCFAFFETSHRIAINADQKEYLLAKSFEHVFEAMIDELIGEKNPPRGLKEQTDGKRVDHMYTYYGLTHSNEQQDEIYYIGDSKYYKAGHPLGRESVYKQYTYARNKQNEKAAWRTEVRDIFRREIRQVLQDKFDFFALKSKGNALAGEQFIKDHFKELQGKLYRPYGDRNLYALALEKREGADTKDSETYHLLNEFFEIKSVTLGENPKEQLEQQVAQYQAEHPYSPVPKDWLPEYHVERYLDDYFVVGLYHDQEHWDWITGKNDRGSLIYNVRLDPTRQGAMPKSRIRKMRPKFAILYEEGHEEENKYHVFRIHDFAEMSEDRMRQALYPREPKGDYFVFRFDEEVTIGHFDIHRLISTHRVFDSNFVEGGPVYPTGKELMDCKL